MHHFPLEVVASCSPVVVVNGFFSINGDKVVGGVGSEFAVEVACGDDGLLVVGEALGGFLYYREHLRHSLVKLILIDLEDFLFEFVYLFE